MIFRRIKAHVEKENWFAVFADFAIVVGWILSRVWQPFKLAVPLQALTD